MNENGVRISSSSTAESSMEDTSNGHRHRHRRKTLTKDHSLTISDHHANKLLTSALFEAEGVNQNDEENFEGGGSGMWMNFNNSFQEVQSVLDRNRVLIQQVNENHQSKLHDNLVNNVALIQEINGNISKVVSLYSDLSVNFSSLFHQRNKTAIQSEGNSEKSVS